MLRTGVSVLLMVYLSQREWRRVLPQWRGNPMRELHEGTQRESG